MTGEPFFVLQTAAADASELRALRITPRSVHDFWMQGEFPAAAITTALACDDPWLAQGGAVGNRLGIALYVDSADGPPGILNPPAMSVCLALGHEAVLWGSALAVGLDSAGAIIGLSDEQVSFVVEAARVTAHSNAG